MDLKLSDWNYNNAINTKELNFLTSCFNPQGYSIQVYRETGSSFFKWTIDNWAKADKFFSTVEHKDYEIAQKASIEALKLFYEGKAMDKDILEGPFQTLTIKFFHLLGWSHYHTGANRKNRGGWPDLNMLRFPQIIFFELKRNSGYPSPSQKKALADLKRIAKVTPNMKVGLYKPKDWIDMCNIGGGLWGCNVKEY